MLLAIAFILTFQTSSKKRRPTRKERREAIAKQLWMYENESTRIDDRIVSINQPHIRPIVRGKARTPVEFGAKLESLLFRPICFFRSFKERIILMNQEA